MVRDVWILYVQICSGRGFWAAFAFFRESSVPLQFFQIVNTNCAAFVVRFARVVRVGVSDIAHVLRLPRRLL